MTLSAARSTSVWTVIRLFGRAIGERAVWIPPQAGHHLRGLDVSIFATVTSMSMAVCPTELAGRADSGASLAGHAFWSISYASSAGLRESERNSLAV